MSARDAALRTIEASYDMNGLDERAWLEGMRVALDGLGLGPWIGYVVDGRSVGSFVGEFPLDPSMIFRAASTMREDLLRAGHAPAPAVEWALPKWSRVAEHFGLSLADLEREWGYSVPQITAVLGTDARGTGAFFSVGAPLAARTGRTLTEVAAHIASAYRLRARLCQQAEPDAVCAPDGKLLDASGDAAEHRDSIALAVKSVDRARGKLRRLDPEEAVATWNAMVDGRWSLVDRVENDGKRYVLVHENPPLSTIAALREIEARVATFAALGHSDKYIAYELGLPRSTIATHLRAALKKLRVSNRRELARIYGPLARASD